MADPIPPPPPPPPPPTRRRRWLSALVWVLLLAAIVGAWMFGPSANRQELTYSELKQHIAAGDVDKVTISSELIEGTLKPETKGDEPVAFRTIRVEDEQLVPQLEAAGVEIEGTRMSTGWSALLWILPWLVIPLIFGLFLWRGTKAMGTGLSFGKSPAKLLERTPADVDFDDVAGCEEAKAELREVVDFLADAERFEALGARIPKGVLLVGPPGTGKTLMARAVAGEAKVPFFSLSGSDFVEMFVGVGAARVRDLFEQAKRHAPCIVFLDELDAIGRRRGVHMGVVNDEREQTLNQLLVELDGFEPNSGVILLAATNRPDVLDPALLRPGRFDRQVVLDAPDLDGRIAILNVHVRGKPLADDVELEGIARATPGFSGADLANLVNEAALGAVRRGGKTIGRTDLEEAVEKVLAGPERRSRRLGEAQKRRVAVHEIGHALVAHLDGASDPVQKISIVPRGRAALGYTLQLPEDDRLLVTRRELSARLDGLLAGRAAEALVFGDVSSGAEDDLRQATTLARRMAAVLGMGETTGLAHVAHTEEGFFARGDVPVLQRDCSEETAREIDVEVERLLQESYERAHATLAAHRGDLDRLVAALLERESLDRATFVRVLETAAE